MREEKYYHHHHDKSGSAHRIGKEAEQRFEDLMRSKMEVRLTTFTENKYEHTDIKISRDGNSWKTVDVKGMKSLTRDASQQDDLIWIEVSHAKFYPNGWAYAGVDYIAFELEGCFAMVKPETLQNEIAYVLGSDITTIIKNRKEDKTPFYKLKRKYTHEICRYLDDDGYINKNDIERVTNVMYKRGGNEEEFADILILITKEQLFNIATIIKK